MYYNIHLVCNISLCWWFGKNNPRLHSVTRGSTTSRFGTANKLYLTPACGPIRGQQTPRQRCGPIRGQHIASSCRSRSGAAVLLGANKLCVHQSRQTCRSSWFARDSALETWSVSVTGRFGDSLVTCRGRFSAYYLLTYLCKTECI